MWATLKGESTYQGKGTGKKGLNLVLSGKALEALKAEVEDYIAEQMPAKKVKGVNRPFKEKDGKVYIKAETYAFEKDTRKEKFVPLSNAKGEAVKQAVDVGNGSVVRLKVTLQMTEYQGKDYLKFWLNALQIRKLEVYVAGGGFEADEEEDGWTGDEFDGEADEDGSAADAPKEDGSDF